MGRASPFRGFIAAASLKRSGWTNTDKTRTGFPRLHRRGLIEAIRANSSISASVFFRRGLIEASDDWLPFARSTKAFRGFIAAASLKRIFKSEKRLRKTPFRGFIAAASLKLITGRDLWVGTEAFRGFIAAASLKHWSRIRRREHWGNFPRLHRRGLIEAGVGRPR